MEIKVKLYSTMQKYAVDGMVEFLLKIKQGTEIKTIPEMLHIPDNLEYRMLLNHGSCNLDTVLKKADTLIFFPLMDGG